MAAAAAGRPVALVTGGGTGVGAATCLALAGRGWDVIVNYSRSAAEAEATAEACRGLGARAQAVQASVAEDADCRRLVGVAEGWGRLDALVGSAGTTQFVPMSELDRQNAEDFQQIYAVNVVGPYQMARAAAPLLRASGRGAIVHVSSVGALNGNGSSFSYVTSKAALNALTLALARTLAPEIRVNAVLPGFIETRWLARGLGEGAYDQVRQGWVDASALGRVCSAEDVAEAIVWLVDGTSMVTGQLITIDGGFLLGRPPRVSR
jgi:3-oxoacyl-[acyl-carrier protein] reductase